MFAKTVGSWKWWLTWLQIVAGSALVSAGFVLFINPYNIVPGGVYGAGVVLHYLFPSIQVGTFGFMFDIPLLLIGIKVFGKMFGAKTVVGAFLTPTFMNSLTYWIGNDPATMLHGKIDLSNDIILACLFGGVMLGMGVGLVLRARATTGGTDIVAMLLNKFVHMPISNGVFLADSLIVIFGIVVLGDWKLPLYSLITIFVSSKVIDYVLDGASYDKLLFIVSEKHEDLRSYILDELERGATYIKSSGMYTRRDKEMIFLVVSRKEVTAVQRKIKDIDPAAFVVVVNAYETFGDGFKAFPDKND